MGLVWEINTNSFSLWEKGRVREFLYERTWVFALIQGRMESM